MLKFDPEITVAVAFLAFCGVFASMGAGWLGAPALGFVCTLLSTPVIALLHA